MVKSKKGFKLIETEWPEFGTAERPASPTAQELLGRIAEAERMMKKRGLTHLVVYADREHSANLLYLANFDPRFEEALMIVRPGAKPLLVLGNECEGYAPISPLFNAGKIRLAKYQTFSLLSQPRDNSRPLWEIFAGEGITENSKVGCVGWKYYTEVDHLPGEFALDLPSYIVDILRCLAGADHVVNATDMFMHPDYGLRTQCSASEIAYFEYTNVLAAEGMRNMIFGMREGMTDHEICKLAGYNGEPMGCHMTMVVGDTVEKGFPSPLGATLKRGDPFATNICYWGSNSCRAGWAVESEKELPERAKGYVDDFAGPYFSALVEWFGMMRIGMSGGKISGLMARRMPFKKFGISLNAGHLIHFDEWVSSPIFPGSKINLHSGMVMQIDVIPYSKRYFSTRMEDGIAIADARLRAQIKRAYPDCYARCMARRGHMEDVLGILLPDEVLPLGNITAIVPPYMLRPELVFAAGR